MVAIRRPRKKPEPQPRERVAEMTAQTQELRHRLLAIIGQYGKERQAQGRPATDYEVFSALIITLKDICSDQLELAANSPEQAAKVQLLAGALALQRGVALRRMRTPKEPVLVTCLALAVCMLAELTEAINEIKKQDGQ